MISYAQYREDIMLHRALHHVPAERGFYIDVGAYHPDIDSVTRHFYEHGWRGINVEPGEHLFPLFVGRRPRDINLRVAASDRSGEVTFHEIESGQLGTLEPSVAEAHRASGMNGRSYAVEAMTLTQICEQHVAGNIHFLKIDVENHEGAVVRGMDFARFRPWILVIEATEPNRMDLPSFAAWDPMVRAAGYEFVHTDVLNRYYVASEHPSLIPHFSVPVDNYVYAFVLNERDAARRERDEALRHLEITQQELQAARGQARKPRSFLGRHYGR